ncbi:MAG: hypothetical protein IJG68_04025 [Bacilli bacterium]|nr:hypothetical protein [Bacilli bacterium]
MKKFFYGFFLIIFFIPFIVFAEGNQIEPLEISSLVKNESFDNYYNYQVVFPEEIQKFFSQGKLDSFRLVTSIKVLDNDWVDFSTPINGNLDENYSFSLSSNQDLSTVFMKVKVKLVDDDNKYTTDWSDEYSYSFSTQKRVLLDTVGSTLVSSSSIKSGAMLSNQDHLKKQIAIIGIGLCSLTMICLVISLRKVF